MKQQINGLLFKKVTITSLKAAGGGRSKIQQSKMQKIASKKFQAKVIIFENLGCDQITISAQTLTHNTL